MTDNTKARELAMKQSLQSAYDMGNGRRDISHHPNNPFPQGSEKHGAYERGFADRSAEIDRGQRD